MPKLSPEEAARIAKTYGVTVPDDVEVQMMPPRKMTEDGPVTPREAMRRQRIRFLRNLKFRNAASKRAAAERRAQGLDITSDTPESND